LGIEPSAVCRQVLFGYRRDVSSGFYFYAAPGVARETRFAWMDECQHEQECQYSRGKGGEAGHSVIITDRFSGRSKPMRIRITPYTRHCEGKARGNPDGGSISGTAKEAERPYGLPRAFGPRNDEEKVGSISPVGETRTGFLQLRNSNS
jgi:hypothetical protein